MKYNPAFDGLRALAVLSVLLVHSGVPGFRGGFIGVDVFFVLSGYLITRVLAENPDLLRFYCRRFLRLAPPLALMLCVYVLVAPLVWKWPHESDAALAFLYLSDYTRAYWVRPLYIGHTWSLSVEEHFYLLWPLIFLRFKPTIPALLIAYVLLTAWRWSQADYASAYFRFDAHCTGLVLGCLLAKLPRLRIPAWPGLVVLAVAMVFLPPPETLMQSVLMVGVELAAAVAVIGTPPKWLSTRRLAYIGKLSYGVYLWHVPIAKMLQTFGWGWPATTAVTLTASLALAALSYHTVEAMFRKVSRSSPKTVALEARSPG